MKATGLLASVLLVVAMGCGADDEGAGGSGGGGAGGAGGAGTGGNAGAPSGGTSGSAPTGGTAGSAGAQTGGTGGSAGAQTGGTGGSAGSAGDAGAAGSAGHAGVAGSGGGPPVFDDREVGIRYHTTTGAPSVFDAAFINHYHEGNNRSTAVAQMQAMVDQGVTVIHTTIWPAGGPPASWGSSFPLSQQELANLTTFAEDVRELRSATTGHAPRLYLSLLDGGDSQFKTVQVNNVFPIAAGGSRDGGQFLEAWRQTIHGIVDAVGPVRYSDDSPVLQRIYLGGEIMLWADGSSPYDGPAGWVLQWFMTNMVPELWSACSAAGILPNTYLFAWPIQASKIFDGTWLDVVASTLQWWGTALPAYVPDRIDISAYTGDHSIPDYTSDQRARILATANGMDALMTQVFGPGGRDYAFVEAHYYHVETDHPAVRKEAFNTYRDMMDPGHTDYHPRFRGVHVWPFPYSIQGGPNENGAAPPFDFSEMVP